MEADPEVRRITRMLWALIGLSIVISLVVNFSLGWGVLNQRDQSDRLTAAEKNFSEQVARINLGLRIGTSEIRNLLDRGQIFNPAEGVKAIQGFEASLKQLRGDRSIETEQPLQSLRKQSGILLTLLVKSADWRGQNDKLENDLSRDLSLNKVRRNLTKIYTIINGAVGKRRLEMVLSLTAQRKSRGLAPELDSVQ